MKERSKNALLVLGSLVFCLLLLAVAEIVVRMTTDITFLGNSGNLFTKDRFKDSMGLTPGVTGYSFGQTVYIDDNGFRVGALRSGADSGPAGAKTVLVLGDSVAFGVGVPEENSFVGLLRKAFPDRRFVNTAVIGYAARDYENVFTVLLDKGLTFERAFLFFCLNDVEPVSAEAIRQALDNPVQAMKSFAPLHDINVYLRERSKLYLLVKGLITDPRKRYFLSDEVAYRDSAAVEAQLQPIVRIARLAEQRGIPFTVMIVPYAFQIRPEGRSWITPQKVLSEVLRKHEVDFVDMFPIFAAATVGSTDLFLAHDQTHLSWQGHKLVGDYLGRLLHPEKTLWKSGPMPSARIH